MKKFFLMFFLLTSVAIISSCSDDSDSASQVDQELNTAVLEDFSEHVAQGGYNDLKTKAETLYNNILALEDGLTDEHLEACRTSWRAAREAWEQTESFLFGPVSTAGVDPSIDTWPVDFNALEEQLSSDNEFTDEYIANLDDALKGFHPIEYLIFGENGDKVATKFTDEELKYLMALGKNVKELTAEVAESWDPATSSSYHTVFTTAGAGNNVYETQEAALLEMVTAMAGICDEVANGKINEVLVAQDPSLEESPFSKNSITDFTNNMKGVENVYLADYAGNGTGLEDLVKKYNLSLDSEIKAAISAAIQSLDNIDLPFGEAIIEEPVQVQNAVSAIQDLQEVLEDKLYPFIQQHSN